MTNAADALAVLQNSVARLHGLVEPLSADAIRSPAYPAEWTIADLLCHLGSGSVIGAMRLTEDEVPMEAIEAVWKEWAAKSPEAQVADGLAADAAVTERLAALSEAERAALSLPLGPLTLDFAGVVAFRLNEHVLHTWDVEVVLDPAATLPAEAVALVVDELGLVAQFTGKPTGRADPVIVRTTEPERRFAVALGGEQVTLSAGDTAEPDLTLPAEAFIRLVYGRLDDGAGLIEELRRAFPGP
jgi:uncharacterized protein (TIGR03083 family)